MIRVVNYLLFIFFLYIFCIIGNIARFFSFLNFSNNVLVTEIILYILVLVYMLICPRIFLEFYKIGLILLLVLFSFFIGVLQFGFDDVAFIYFLRLNMYFLSAIIIADIAFNIYKNDYKKFLHIILLHYFFGLCIGFLIFIYFKESNDLWIFLRNFNIEFNGDPHVNRFVSIFFDPNFYAIIAVIPLIISLHLYSVSSKSIYLYAAIAFFVSIILSGSRSGIATCIILLSIKAVGFGFTIKKRFLYATSIVFLVVVLCLSFYIDNIETMIYRFYTIKDDDSALARYISMLFALDTIDNFLFLGMGYGYLASYMLHKGMLSSVDASLLNILANFGLFLSVVIIYIVLYFLFNLLKLAKRRGNRNACNFIYSFVQYIFIVIVFASNFNNILFYFFWFLPTTIILFYFLYFLRRESVQ